MEFRKPNCEVCTHQEVCFQKSMLETIVEDMKSLKYFGDREYGSLLSCFRVDVNCKHFAREGRQEV